MGDFVSMSKDEIDRFSKMEHLLAHKISRRFKARALEKNDFSLSTRQYALTKKDESELYALAVEFGAALGIEHLPKYQLKKLGKTYEQLTKNQP